MMQSCLVGKESNHTAQIFSRSTDLHITVVIRWQDFISPKALLDHLYHLRMVIWVKSCGTAVRALARQCEVMGLNRAVFFQHFVVAKSVLKQVTQQPLSSYDVKVQNGFLAWLLRMKLAKHWIG